MIQTALIAVIFILVVTFFSSPSNEHGKALEDKKETLVQKTEKEKTSVPEETQIVEIKLNETAMPKVDVIIPGIPAPVALPKVANVLDFKDTAKLLDLLEEEKALKEEALITNKKLQKDLEKKEQNEEELQALLAKVAKMAEEGEVQARVYEETVKEKIQSLEKGLLENVHDQKELQTKIENFPSKMDELLSVSEEISQKAESEFEALIAEREALEKEIETLREAR